MNLKEKFPNVDYLLQTIFTSEAGFTEAEMRGLYLRSVERAKIVDALRGELEALFSDESVSWVEILSNDRYDVYAANSEDEAREFARKTLVEPLRGL